MHFRPQLQDLTEPREVMKLISVIAELADVLDVLYTTTAPNGNITARQNRIAFYDNSGVYSLWVNTDGATAWAGMGGELTPGAGGSITDADGDTRIEVEKNPDEDKVRIITKDIERALLSELFSETYIKVNKHSDLDGDTAWEVEKNADEDKARCKTGGTEAMVIDDSQDLYMTSGKKIALDGSTKQFYSKYNSTSGYTEFYADGALRLQI